MTQFFPICETCRFTKLKLGDPLIIATEGTKCAKCGKEMDEGEGYKLIAKAQEQRFGLGEKYEECKERMDETHWKFVEVIGWYDRGPKKA